MAPEPPAAARARFRRFIAFLAPLDDPDARWFAARFAAYLTGAFPPRDLDAALGLRPAPGQRSFDTAERLAARDELYRRLARKHFPDLRPTKQAYAVQRTIRRYVASAWRNEQHLTMCRHGPGTLKALLWQILTLDGGRVLSSKRLRKILAAR